MEIKEYIKKLQKAELHLRIKNSKYVQDKPLELHDE